MASSCRYGRRLHADVAPGQATVAGTSAVVGFVRLVERVHGGYHPRPMPTITTRFSATLFTLPGKGGWTFAPVPPRHAPSTALAWGRMPVVATVDGRRWKTSVWREKSGRTLLPVPKAIRGAKDDGDRVRVELEFLP